MSKKKSAINVYYSLYKKIALSFFTVSILFFIIIFYFSYRKALIKILPNYEIIKTEFIADIKPVPNGQNQLKGRLLQTTLEDTFNFQTKGEIEESLNNIEGTISIINKSSRPQPLIATTRFLTENGILFRLKKMVTIPAKSEINAEIYADASSKITAPIAGKLLIPGLNAERQKEIYGEIKNPIATDTKKIKIITNEDIEDAKEKALDELFKKSLIEFAADIKSEEKVLSKGVVKELINFAIDKKEGEKVDSFSMKIKAKFVAVLFDENELFQIAKTNLENTLSQGKCLANVEKENLVYVIEKYNMETNTANLRVMLAGKSIINFDNEILDKDLITGLEKSAAIAYLKTFKEIKDVEISLVPSWWDRLPKMERSIEIIIAD
ncbi:MAG: hypothetical protein V1891_02080 [bacterium]